MHVQAIIGNYAVPILEEKPVWGTTDETRTAYMDTRDAARAALAALRSDATVGKTLALAGPKVRRWSDSWPLEGRAPVPWHWLGQYGRQARHGSV